MRLYTHALIDLTLIPAGVFALVYTTADLLTIITAIGGLVTLVGGVIVNIILTVQARRQISIVSDKTDAIDAKAGIIGAKVDGAATSAQEQIRALQNEVRLMREIAAEKKETASLLAAAASIPIAAISTSHLTQQIEKNTKDTAVNTEQTDEALQDLKDKL